MSSTDVVVREQPLSATHIRNLERIVKGDFEDLKSSLRMQLHKRFNEKVAALSNRFADEQQRQLAANAFGAALALLRDRAHVAMEKLAGEYPDVDFTGWRFEVQPLQTNGTYRSQQNIPNSKGYDAAYRRLNNAHQRLQGLVETLVDREHRKVERSILLQGVTGSAAADILADMPKAEDILSLISDDLAETASEDLKVLMEDDAPPPAIAAKTIKRVRKS